MSNDENIPWQILSVAELTRYGLLSDNPVVRLLAEKLNGSIEEHEGELDWAQGRIAELEKEIKGFNE